MTLQPYRQMSALLEDVRRMAIKHRCAIIVAPARRRAVDTTLVFRFTPDVDASTPMRLQMVKRRGDDA